MLCNDDDDGMMRDKKFGSLRDDFLNYCQKL